MRTKRFKNPSIERTSMVFRVTKNTSYSEATTVLSSGLCDFLGRSCITAISDDTSSPFFGRSVFSSGGRTYEGLRGPGSRTSANHWRESIHAVPLSRFEHQLLTLLPLNVQRSTCALANASDRRRTAGYLYTPIRRR